MLAKTVLCILSALPSAVVQHLQPLGLGGSASVDTQAALMWTSLPHPYATSKATSTLL